VGSWPQALTAAHDLAAYTTLQSSDVLIEGSAGNSGSPDGRILLRSVKRGEPITEDSLVTPARALVGLTALAVKVETGLMPKPGDVVRVVGVEPGSTDVGFTYDDAVVVDQQPDTLLLAMPEAQAIRAATYLVGDRRLIVLRQLPGDRPRRINDTAQTK